MSKGKKTQAIHRGWNQQSLEARANKQVMQRLDRLLAKQPRPTGGISDKRWNRQVVAYLKEFRSFFKQHATRLKALGIHIEDFGLLDPSTNPVPLGMEEISDPRYSSAEEEEILRDLSRDRLVRFTKLG